MVELLKGAIEWAREQNVSPWSAIWLIGGYLSLRLLAMVGSALSRTASGLFAHYNGVISSLEKRNESQQHELVAVKAELADRLRDIAQLQALITLLRERIDMLNTDRVIRSNPPNQHTGD